MRITEHQYLDALDLAKNYLAQIKKEVDLMSQTNDEYFCTLERDCSIRLVHCIKANCYSLNIDYKRLKLSDIAKFSINELIKFRNMGRKSVMELEDLLEGRGFKLKSDYEQ